MDIKKLDEIKVVALDIYGTVLNPHDDYENDSITLRHGFRDMMRIFYKRRIKIVTSSDAEPQSLMYDLITAGIPDPIKYFDGIYQLKHEIWCPKDFSEIIKDFRIRKPSKLLVIGDSKVHDIEGAINCGAQFAHVSHYNSSSTNTDLVKEIFG